TGLRRTGMSVNDLPLASVLRDESKPDSYLIQGLVSAFAENRMTAPCARFIQPRISSLKSSPPLRRSLSTRTSKSGFRQLMRALRTVCAFDSFALWLMKILGFGNVGFGTRV